MCGIRSGLASLCLVLAAGATVEACTATTVVYTARKLRDTPEATSARTVAREVLIDEGFEPDQAYRTEDGSPATLLEAGTGTLLVERTMGNQAVPGPITTPDGWREFITRGSKLHRTQESIEDHLLRHAREIEEGGAWSPSPTEPEPGLLVPSFPDEPAAEPDTATPHWAG